MSVNIDWSEDHEDFQGLQHIVDNYALDGIDVDIELMPNGVDFHIDVDDAFVDVVTHIGDIIWAIEKHLEHKYRVEYAAEEW